jgi:spore germination protein YaaH
VQPRPARRPGKIKLTPAPVQPRLTPPAPGTRRVGPPIAAAFYVNWDESSYASLRRNLQHLDWVIPEWARLESNAQKAANSPLAVSIDPRALDLVRRDRPQARILPLVQNYHDDLWDGALVGRVLSDDAQRKALIVGIVALLERQGFGGAVIDFEEVPAAAQPALLRFLSELHSQLKERGLVLGEAVPFDDDDWAYPAHAAAADYLFLMAYGSAPLDERARPDHRRGLVRSEARGPPRGAGSGAHDRLPRRLRL